MSLKTKAAELGKKVADNALKVAKDFFEKPKVQVKPVPEKVPPKIGAPPTTGLDGDAENEDANQRVVKFSDVLDAIDEVFPEKESAMSKFSSQMKDPPKTAAGQVNLIDSFFALAEDTAGEALEGIKDAVLGDTDQEKVDKLIRLIKGKLLTQTNPRKTKDGPHSTRK